MRRHLIRDLPCLRIYPNISHDKFQVDPTVGSSRIANRKKRIDKKIQIYLGYRKILRNQIRDHPTSPNHLSTTHKNYRVDRTVGSSRIHEPITETTISTNPKQLRFRLMIYRHVRIEISILISLTTSPLHDPGANTRRHYTTCVCLDSTIFQTSPMLKKIT